MDKRKLSAIIANLPEVQEMLADDAAREERDALNARLQCIDKIIAMRKQQIKIQSECAEASERVRLARLALAEAIEKAAPKASELTSINGALNAEMRELRDTHAESIVQSALSLVQSNLRESTRRAEIISESLSRNICDDFGRVLYSVPQPQNAHWLALENERNAKLQEAFESLRKLVEARVSPRELTEQVESVLHSCGQTPQDYSAGMTAEI